METFLQAGESNALLSIFGGSDDGSEVDQGGEGDCSCDGAGNDNDPAETADAMESLVHKSLSGNLAIHLLQQKRRGLAHQLWPAAIQLCNYIETHSEDIFKQFGGVSRTRVVELGAGIGLVGLFVAALGCPRVVVTDLPEVLGILQANIDRNDAEEWAANVHARALCWGSGEQEVTDVLAEVALDAVPGNSPAVKSSEAATSSSSSLPPSSLPGAASATPPTALVVVADCVYWEILFAPLVSTLVSLCLTHGCTVLMSHVRRWKKDAKFFKLCAKSGLSVDCLLETVEMVPAENTGRLERTITRVYRIGSKATPRLNEAQTS